MTETAPSPAPPPAETSAKKKQPAAAKSRPVKSGPSVSELIVKAVSASKERSGVSLAALKKALTAGGYDVEKNNSRLKLALKGLVSKETLIQLKGSGASGSFKLNKKQLESREKTSKKKEIPIKPKKVASKKVVKSPKKAPAGVKKSPKKIKKPSAAAKSPKKPKFVKAKKAGKSPAKKVTKPKAVKSPAKPQAKKAAPKK
ncbi:histone H1B-like [Spea bombifrons]|uniref:histone H1B-like n=1 Tax=Spea bombifrons TaxID=233779 RepID=UPI00234BE5F2|nr:histone H1B-like [Spea bombifrons]